MSYNLRGVFSISTRTGFLVHQLYVTHWKLRSFSSNWVSMKEKGHLLTLATRPWTVLHPDFLLTSSACVSSGCCLQSFFPKIFCVHIDESHQTQLTFEASKFAMPSLNLFNAIPPNMVKRLLLPQEDRWLITEAPEVPVPQAGISATTGNR